MKGENLSRKVTPEIISKLQDIVGIDNVNTNDMDRMLYGHDLAPLPKEAGLAFKNMPDVIVRPSTTEEVSAIVKVAYETGVAIIPRGQSTWGLGGSMPTNGGILLDMASKMNNIVKVDTVNMSVRAQAGTSWKAIIDACDKEGFLVGSYPSSFPSATIGAWFSTSGIGPGGYKYGSARDNALNMQVVLSDGTIIETGYDALANNMSGYNLNQLFGGAEGTLGVICECTYRIYPKGIIKPVAYEFDRLRDMGEPINAICKHPSVKPLHIAWSDFNHFENQRKAGIHAPDVANLLLVTFQGDEAFVNLEEGIVDKFVEEAGGRKLSYDIAEHEWEERCYEFRARRTGVGSIPAEVVVTNDNWAKFVDECYEGYKTMKMEPGGIIGMVADRSTSMFMPYYFKDDESLLGMTAFAYNFYMGGRAAEYGGRSLGLGVFFASNLDAIHDAGSVALMRSLKTHLDPHDVINPGHLVCGNTKFGITLNKNIMGIASKLMCGVKKVLPENKTFQRNLARFHYDDMEHEKELSREVDYVKGTE